MNKRIKYSLITGAIAGGFVALIAGLVMMSWSAALIGFFGPFALCLLFGSESIDADTDKTV